MKRINLSIICTAALLLALPFAGCMHADSGTATQKATELTQEVNDGQPEDNECPDGDCDDNDNNRPDGERPDGDCKDKCPEDGGKCPDGKCPKRKLPPKRHGKRRKSELLPCPICGDNN